MSDVLLCCATCSHLCLIEFPWVCDLVLSFVFIPLQSVQHLFCIEVFNLYLGKQIASLLTLQLEHQNQETIGF